MQIEQSSRIKFVYIVCFGNILGIMDILGVLTLT